MFSRFKNFLYRHRRKFMVTGVVIGGAVLASRYAQRKFFEWQEREAREFLEKSQKEVHFRSTERTCNQTICSLSETLKETILKIIDAETHLGNIRKGGGNKFALWNELKILVFAQIASLIYAGLMLVIILRIKLSVMGGYMFREKQDANQPVAFTPERQEKYLSMCHHFINSGVKELCTFVETHVRKILTPISLKQKMSLQDVEEIFWAIQTSISSDPMNPINNLPKYLLPSSCVENAHSTSDFDVIIDETVELLKSEEVISLADSSLKRAFTNTVDRLVPYYNQTETAVAPVNGNKINTDSNENFKNVTQVKIPFAKILPIVHGLSKNSVQTGEIDNWIKQYLLMEKINILGANLYEAFSSPK